MVPHKANQARSVEKDRRVHLSKQIIKAILIVGVIQQVIIINVSWGNKTKVAELHLSCQTSS